MGSRARIYAQKILEKKEGMTPFERVKLWFDVAGSEGYEGHDRTLPAHLSLVSATLEPTPSNPHNSRTVFSLTVPKELCNMSGNLHGGAVALIFDICTSTAISACSSDGFWDTGHVSRTLNCTYLRPAMEGQKVFVESEVVHLGRRMGQVVGRIVDEKGKVCYTCEHGKAAVGGSAKI
ncbi:HotDog domain-containing protein [Lophiotrema nucula]|uniref:HotDog domain-containing protein n=1 Tax=Lophiotrema nucula TaxID=690887 RepID=A0A6A5YHF3_9PLEO|nr:HotDog domain-containing protein [Lophiotrema nucula]